MTREYAKVCPKAWHGATFKALRKKGPKALVVGLYLMTSPSSNMLGLYVQPILYMAHETGLGEQGALEGLQGCIEAGFCAYDEASEVVWVFEMAKYQIADELKASDLRCKGIQKDYDGLPDNPFLSQFFDHYSAPFHMTRKRDGRASTSEQKQAPSQAPSKPLRSQEQEQEQEKEKEQKKNSPQPPKGGKSATSLKAWLQAVKTAGEKPVPEDDPVHGYAEKVGLPHEFLALAWVQFKHRYGVQHPDKRYRDWRRVFRNAVEGNWLKLWYVDPANGQYGLTTVGLQAKRANEDRNAA